jgi:glycerophosphoryl diester phosphodiesterase
MKDLSWLKTYHIAHRGLHTKDLSVPENSLKAFRLAMEKGYALELDLNILKDDTIIVFHDNNLKRVVGVDAHMSTLTYDQIKDLTLNDTKEHIPTLDALLELVNGQVPLLIELKPFGNINKFCELVYHRLKAYQGTFAIFSFHPGIVKWFKKNAPDIARGQISKYFEDDASFNPILKFMLKRLWFNVFTKPDFISYDIKHLPNKYVNRAQKHGKTIISFTATSQKDLDFVQSRYTNVVFQYFIPK